MPPAYVVASLSLVIATSDRQLILRKGFVWPCGYLCVCVGGGGRSSRDCSDKGETNEGELGCGL